MTKQIIKHLSLLALGGASLHASITLSGNAFSNVPGIAVGNVAVLLFDNNPQDTETFTSLAFDVGDLITSNNTFGNFTVALGTHKSAILFGSNINISGAFNGIDISVDSITTVDPGDTFAWVVFKTSSTTLTAGTAYEIYTNPTWVVPVDGNYGFAATPSGSNIFQQMNASNAATYRIASGVVAAVPEPSSFAALAGLGMLGFAATRKRRRA